MKILYLTLLFVLPAFNALSQAPTISSFTPVSGNQYAEVQISGSNFTNVTSVRFGNSNQAYFYIINDNLIYAYPGQGASGSVYATNPAGTGSKPGFTFIPPPVITSFSPTAAGLGDTVTIQGSLFSNVTDVYFGDSAALSFVIVSDHIIKAVVGNGTSGDISIYTPDDDSYLGGFLHTGPEILSFTPTAGIQGTIIHINGHRFTGTTAVKFGGIPASSFQVSGDTLINATVGSGGPGDVYVATSHGYTTAPGFILPGISYFYPSFGSIGTADTIIGRNFTGTTAVFFGNTPAASFTIVSDTMIRAIVEAGESGFIKVQNGALEVTSLQYFSFSFPTPYISGFTPAAAQQGATVVIHGSQLAGTTDVSFGNTPAASFTIISDSVINAIVGTGSSGLVSLNSYGFFTAQQGFTFIPNIPVIAGFLPKTGAPGTNVIITGAGFSTTASQNIVYFGGVKAHVNSSTFFSLNVNVPPGAGNQRISVTNAGLTAYSSKPFDVTFAGAASTLLPNYFVITKKYKTAAGTPKKTITADFNGDGKLDVLVLYDYQNTTTPNILAVYRNTCTTGFISLAPPITFAAGGPGYGGYDAAAADIDGDGKLDIVITNSSQSLASVFLNTGSSGNISFAPKVDFVTAQHYGPDGTDPVNINVNDFDGDGKPDLVFGNFGLDNWCKAGWMHNNSSPGVVSFSAPAYYPVVDGYGAYEADLNNDNKPDLSVGININGNFMNQVSTFKNVSTAGIIDFQENNNAGDDQTHTFEIAPSDLDGDGKTDLVAQAGYGSLTILKNTSIDSGYIEFAAPITLPVLQSLTTVRTADIDGDGLPDILSTYANGNRIFIYKNKSVPGTITMAPLTEYITGPSPKGITVADLDGDGKQDLITANAGDTSIVIFRNRIGEPVDLCPSAAGTSFIAGLAGTSFQWQISTNGGTTYSNLANSSVYSGVTGATLQITNILSSAAGSLFRCLVNAAAGPVYKIRFADTWTGAINSSWNNPGNWSCGTVPDANTDTIIESGSVVVSTNSSCRSITVLPGAALQVNTGIIFTVTH